MIIDFEQHVLPFAGVRSQAGNPVSLSQVVGMGKWYWGLASGPWKGLVVPGVGRWN